VRVWGVSLCQWTEYSYTSRRRRGLLLLGQQARMRAVDDGPVDLDALGGVSLGTRQRHAAGSAQLTLIRSLLDIMSLRR
jgi:hypothetical protein